MNTVNKLVAPVIFGLALVVAMLAALVQPVSAQNNSQNNQEQSNQQNQNSEAIYSYVAQPGDSYSKIARKAIQTYGLKNKVDLNQAQIIFAETNLTIEAGSPKLIVGQAIKINETTIKGWVDKAKELNQDKQAAWQKYVVGVNFNTDRVGQNS